MSGGIAPGGTSELNLFFICPQPGRVQEFAVFTKNEDRRRNAPVFVCIISPVFRLLILGILLCLYARVCIDLCLGDR